MSHFYGSMKGNRSEKTSCGGKDAGIIAHLRGWNIGGKVSCRHVEGMDIVSIDCTGGSNNSESLACLEFYRNADGTISVYLGEAIRKAFGIKSRIWTRTI